MIDAHAGVPSSQVRFGGEVRPFKGIFIFLALLPAMALTVPSSAQPSPAPSSTRPSGGMVISDFGSDEEGGGGLAIQSDGKIVQTGTTGRKILVIRYTTTGAFDATFGDRGKVTVDFGPGVLAGGSDVAIQSDGKIVVSGTATTRKDPLDESEDKSDFAVIRLNTSGSLDPTFGADGKVTTDLGSGNEHGAGLAIQSDGKLLVAGGKDKNFALIRYTATGSFDPGFGTGGKATTDFGLDMYADAATVAIQPDGKIVAAGSTSLTRIVEGGSAQPDIAVARYTTAGILDPSFGHGGKVITSFGLGGDAAEAAAIQPDGKILVAGYSRNDFTVLRYSTKGGLDHSFGDQGKAITRFGSAETDSSALAFGLAIQSDGRIVVAGVNENGADGGSDLAMVRYRKGGAPDRTFGHKGKVTTDFGSLGDHCQGLAIEPDGMIVVSGSTSEIDDQDNEIGDVAIARYTTTGSLDPNFGVEETSPSPLVSASAALGRGRPAEPENPGERAIVHGASVGGLLVLASVLVLVLVRHRRAVST
jgi:uncharacterized delta-60 repeat protein